MSTKPLGILLVDDEALARSLLREYLTPQQDIRILGECDNGLTAVEQIAALKPDLIFLDVQMPGLNGLEVLEASGRRGGVIFTTAHDEFALSAFDFHAVDYLLKPFSRQRFDQALDKARASHLRDSGAVNALVAAEARRALRLLVPVRGRVEVVAVEDIDYIEAQDDYINIHAGPRALLKTQSLSEVEGELDPASFVRIHRSFLLNLKRLKAVERAAKDSIFAVLHQGARLPISRSGMERIRALLPGI